MIKYTKERLQSAVLKSISVQDVARILIGKPVSGNQHRHLREIIKKFEIDTSHFLGSGHYRGKVSNKRKLPDKILVKGRRQKSFQLRRAMLEKGVKYACLFCGISSWRNEKINLEIDHIDGNSLDSRIENLRFLCPNCHSQTKTFGYKGKITKAGRAVDARVCKTRLA